MLAALRIPAVFMALCFFLTQTAFTQELSELYQPKVKISITADRGIENEMRSYISRELRSLPNVKVVSNDFNWELQIVAIEAKVSGQSAGVVASVVANRSLGIEGMISILSKNISLGDKEKQFLAKYIRTIASGAGEVESHVVYSDSDENLRSMCEKIVAEFDGGQLEPYRQNMQDAIQDAQN